MSGAFVRSFTYRPSNPPGRRVWGQDLSSHGWCMLCLPGSPRDILVPLFSLSVAVFYNKWALCIWMPLPSRNMCTLSRGIWCWSDWPQAPWKVGRIFMTISYWLPLGLGSCIGMLSGSLPSTAFKGSCNLDAPAESQIPNFSIQTTVWVPEKDGIDLGHCFVFFLLTPFIFSCLDHWRI